MNLGKLKNSIYQNLTYSPQTMKILALTCAYFHKIAIY